ncbi:MAG TPA: hypothetical protein VK154_16140, partial [Chitinophagales bacterium]|nr:hypothetical protein [Chitinophagales bacterium]
ISIFSTAYTYEKGAAHGWTEFNTLNYNALTGQQINFRQFITPDRLSSLEDLLMHKLTERFRDFDFDRQHYLRQLKDLQFSLSDEGIEVLFAGDTYATAIMDILITYAELEPFANKQGLLKPFYQ